MELEKDEEKEKREKEVMPKHKKTRRKAPRGYHYMPDVRLMKNAAHKKRKKKKK